MPLAPPTPAVTLILGGARSGKSRYAQARAAVFPRVLFLATATAGDEEMRRKIAQHQLDRPAHWTTVEEPLDLPTAITHHAPTHDIAVVDCLTFYASNLLHLEDESAIAAELDRFLAFLAAPPCPVLLVSNEAGSGVVPAYELGRRFRDLLGELNQRVAAVATEVLLLVAGLPLTLKPQAATHRIL